MRYITLLIVIIIAIVVIYIAIIQLLWNCIMPSILNLPELTFWQTFWLWFLYQMLCSSWSSLNTKR